MEFQLLGCDGASASLCFQDLLIGSIFCCKIVTFFYTFVIFEYFGMELVCSLCHDFKNM